MPCGIAISTLSLGQHQSHGLDEKIQCAGRHGFTGIEIVFSDLQRYSKSQGISLIEGAEKIAILCKSQGLEILSLAPFENFEGHNSPIDNRLPLAQHWMNIARILSASYLQVPAQYSLDCTGNWDVIVSELQQLADMGTSEQPTVAVAYEPMSWSIHFSTWEDALKLVTAVNRPSFGLCLDSFHLVTKLWGSPFERSGKYPHADQRLADSLHLFQQQCPLDNISYIQFSDCELFDPPFSRSHPWYVEGEAPEFTWSKHGRPFPFETELGGYMPVAEIAKAWVLEKGFKGWISLEVFDRRMREKEYSIETAGTRAKESWKRLQSIIEPENRL